MDARRPGGTKHVLQFCVVDNGPGIAAAVLGVIFLASLINCVRLSTMATYTLSGSRPISNPDPDQSAGPPAGLS